MLCSAAEAVSAETAASEGGGREMKEEEDGEEVEPPPLRPPPPPRPPPLPRLPPPPRLSLPPAPLSESAGVDIARTSRHPAGGRGVARLDTESEEREKHEEEASI